MNYKLLEKSMQQQPATYTIAKTAIFFMLFLQIYLPKFDSNQVLDIENQTPFIHNLFCNF